jgi:hypothetical protein
MSVIAADEFDYGALRLRKDVTVAWTESTLDFSVGKRVVNFTVREESLRQAFVAALRGLARKSDPSEQPASPKDLSPEMKRFFGVLHKQRLVLRRQIASETAERPSALHERFIFAAVEARDHLKFRDLRSELQTNPAALRLVQGIAQEYYAITKRAYSAVAPALVHDIPALRTIICRFLREENGHDLIMAEGLRPYGIGELERTQLVPLVYTQAIVNRLACAAKDDVLLFALLIYFFEMETEFDGEFPEILEFVGAPTSFTHAVRTHNQINNEGNHSDISLEIYEVAAQVLGTGTASHLDAELWRFNVLFQKYHNSLIEYYSDEGNYLARLSPSMLQLNSSDVEKLLTERWQDAEASQPTSYERVCRYFAHQSIRVLGAAQERTEDASVKVVLADAILEIADYLQRYEAIISPSHFVECPAMASAITDSLLVTAISSPTDAVRALSCLISVVFPEAGRTFAAGSEVRTVLATIRATVERQSLRLPADEWSTGLGHAVQTEQLFQLCSEVSLRETIGMPTFRSSEI